MHHNFFLIVLCFIGCVQLSSMGKRRIGVQKLVRSVEIETKGTNHKERKGNIIWSLVKGCQLEISQQSWQRPAVDCPIWFRESKASNWPNHYTSHVITFIPQCSTSWLHRHLSYNYTLFSQSSYIWDRSAFYTLETRSSSSEFMLRNWGCLAISW